MTRAKAFLWITRIQESETSKPVSKASCSLKYGSFDSDNCELPKMPSLLIQLYRCSSISMKGKIFLHKQEILGYVSFFFQMFIKFVTFQKNVIRVCFVDHKPGSQQGIARMPGDSLLAPGRQTAVFAPSTLRNCPAGAQAFEKLHNHNWDGQAICQNSVGVGAALITAGALFFAMFHKLEFFLSKDNERVSVRCNNCPQRDNIPHPAWSPSNEPLSCQSCNHLVPVPPCHPLEHPSRSKSWSCRFSHCCSHSG